MGGKVSFIETPLIKKESIEFREYQVNLAETALKSSTMVVLGTGLGKTVVAALLAAKRMDQLPKSKVVFLAPSRPLADQQARFLRRVLDIDSSLIVCLTGHDTPNDRKSMWMNAWVIVMTPQSLQNDIIQGSYDLRDVSLIVYDEAHRGVGNYAYTFIAELYEKQCENCLALGLTASPGHKAEDIKVVCKNLRLDHVEVRTERSPDVRNYIVAIDSDVHYVTLPSEVEVLRDILYSLLTTYISPAINYGFSLPDSRRLSRKEILTVQGEVRKEIGNYTTPPKHLFMLIRNLTAALRIVHLLEFVGTQGLLPTHRYVQGMYEEIRNKRSSKGVKDLISRAEFRQFENLLAALIAKGYRHPKIDALFEIVSEYLSMDKDSRILVFTRFRDTAAEVVDALGQIEEARVSKFVGQSSRGLDKGFTQKKQIEILDGFRSNEFNILVATQVGEEGLDIPECNLVVFYDCVPSVVPYIQRRGRTGRRTPGKVVIFVAKDTHDEYYHWSVIHKLKKMPKALEAAGDEAQTSLEEFEREQEELEKGEGRSQIEFEKRANNERIQLIIDSRELSTAVARELARLNIELSGETLEIADYIASEDVAIERKEVGDFLQSLIDGRLFTQLSAMRNAYKRPVLIMEGEQLIGQRAINPAAIYGALASIAVRLQVPVVWTRNPVETAQLLYRIARLEQVEESRVLRTRSTGTGLKDAEVLEYILSGFPGIDTVISRAIFERFGTLENIFSAPEEDLRKVRGVGATIARRIRRYLTTHHPNYNRGASEE